jgi:hypothetical protein
MAYAVATNNFWGAILSLTLPSLLRTFGPVGVFGFYAGLNFVAFWMIFLWLPETKQRTLEELDYVFAVPTRTHMKYQMTKAAPYFFRRHILRRSGGVEPHLYKFDEIEAPKRTLADEIVKEPVTGSNENSVNGSNGTHKAEEAKGTHTDAV